MQAAPRLVVLAFLLVAGGANAAPLAFDTPGEFRATWAGAHEVSWALLVFRNETAASFGASTTEPTVLVNETYTSHVRVQRDGLSFTPRTFHDNTTWTPPTPFTFQADFQPKQDGSLLVVAERIQLNAHDSRGILSSKEDGASLRGFARDDDLIKRIYRVPSQELPASVVVAASPLAWNEGAPFNILAHGVTYLEWYNADTTCRSTCPGGGPEVTHFPAPPEYKITSERHTYEVLKGNGIQLHGRGTFDYALFGSSVLTLGVDGAVRLPLAASDESCDCITPDNQTFSAVGNLTFRGLRAAPGGGLRAEMGGDLETAYFDEIAVDPSLVFTPRNAAVGAVALGGGLLLLKLVKMLWPALFTRHMEEPLDNERRRRIYEIIQKNPGLHFREVIRRAGVQPGVGRHHITKLVRAGLVIEHRHHNSLCLFPMDGRPKNALQEMAALRDPDHRLLYNWLQTNPEKTQGEIIAAFGVQHGWTRSTTQYRLDHLLEDGVVRCRYEGKRKLHSVARPVVVLAGGPQAVASAPA